jgi:hypothetical protein
LSEKAQADPQTLWTSNETDAAGDAPPEKEAAAPEAAPAPPAAAAPTEAEPKE